MEQIDFSKMTLVEIDKLMLELSRQKDLVKNEEKPILKFIEDIKKAKISNSLLTRYLIEENLIDYSQIKAQKPEKTTLCEVPITTETGRDSTFKIWLKDGKPREPWMEPASKDNWKKVRSIGFEKFLEKFNSVGQEWLKTEQGIKWKLQVEKQFI